MGKSVTINTADTPSIADRAKLLDEAIASGTIKLAPAYESSKLSQQSLGYPDFSHTVNQGALMLDQTDPGWDDRLDLSLLDLDDQKSCILGQGWHHYRYAREINSEEIEGKNGFDKFLGVLVTDGGTDARVKFAVQHGFALTPAAYAWINGMTAQRWHAVNGTYGVTIGNGHEWTALLNAVEAEVWEQLTLTWIMLIKARQQVRVNRMPGRVPVER